MLGPGYKYFMILIPEFIRKSYFQNSIQEILSWNYFFFAKLISYAYLLTKTSTTELGEAALVNTSEWTDKS